MAGRKLPAALSECSQFKKGIPIMAHKPRQPLGLAVMVVGRPLHHLDRQHRTRPQEA